MTAARFRIYAAVAVVFAGFLVFIVCGFTGHFMAGLGAFLVCMVLCAFVRPSYRDEMEEKERMSLEYPPD